MEMRQAPADSPHPHRESIITCDVYTSSGMLVYEGEGDGNSYKRYVVKLWNVYAEKLLTHQ